MGVSAGHGQVLVIRPSSFGGAGRRGGRVRDRWGSRRRDVARTRGRRAAASSPLPRKGPAGAAKAGRPRSTMSQGVSGSGLPSWRSRTWAADRGMSPDRGTHSVVVGGYAAVAEGATAGLLRDIAGQRPVRNRMK
ncbi:hypothetical protein C884_01643 [Kocuria palustris PEL]|uniref:Uncharacterized protein n=1 Tax=Kocuria palustris PEL TaxID=1236550 RepID=M2WGB5_9MICC|nr:hypothetical protein C884_01643 [Kocuria palustris PEL]